MSRSNQGYLITKERSCLSECPSAYVFITSLTKERYSYAGGLHLKQMLFVNINIVIISNSVIR